MADEPVQGRLTATPEGVVEDLIFRRRSIRRYKRQPLPEEWIEAMLRCAHQAPSPSNRQPVRFIRIESQIHHDRLKQALHNGHETLLARHQNAHGTARLRNRINAYRRYAEVLFAAPHLLAVAVSTETKGFSDYLDMEGLGIKSVDASTDLDITVGLALQGLMLKAQALGVGTCVLTAPLAFIDDVEQLLGLDQLKIKCFLALGVPHEIPQAPARLPLDSVVMVI